MEEEEIDPGNENEGDKEKHCYCNGGKESTMLQCSVCKMSFHPGCLKSGRPSPLAGDVYFCLTCSRCSDDGQETCYRTNISWMQTVYLALYNLSLVGSGRKGYFRWKEDICQFVERHWSLLFPNKKRSTSWCSTIAGTLSVGCPRYFKSGQQEFKETGWWALKDNVPPAEKVSSPGSDGKKRKNSHRRGNSKKKMPKKETSREEPDVDMSKDATDGSLFSVTHEQDVSIESLLPSVAMDTDVLIPAVSGDDEGELLMDNVTACSAFLEMEDPCTFIRDSNLDDQDCSSSSDEDIPDMADHGRLVGSTSRSSTPISDKQSDIQDQDGQSDVHDQDRQSDVHDQDRQSDKPSVETSAASTRSNRSRKQIDQEVKPVVQEDRMVSVTEAQEHQLLCRLNACPHAVRADPKARRLRRKLLLRKIKRDRALPLFDADKILMESLHSTTGYILDGEDVVPERDLSTDGNSSAMQDTRGKKPSLSSVPCFARSNRVLDRYMAAPQMLRGHRVPASSSFRRLLVGVEQQAHVRPFTSPYTARVLKPYIRRDYESQPLKLKLMNELLEVTHRSNPEWHRPPSSPIDYCYVQPHHIAAVNNMCREFFWPGIDLSECLQYPDFSCVVLYRNYVIAFAFMVPDVKYNEAYISFILVHPEWRRAGIGTYMLYHLIQTCMGKDVTLHVSVTNPAMMLYQRLGFKPEEFILDFYDRYLPENSPECRHAFFLRLRR